MPVSIPKSQVSATLAWTIAAHIPTIAQLSNNVDCAFTLHIADDVRHTIIRRNTLISLYIGDRSWYQVPSLLSHSPDTGSYHEALNPAITYSWP